MLLHSSHAAAGAFRMPGQELWGKWEVVSHDVRGLGKPLGEDFFTQMDRKGAFLPIGQMIAIEGGYQVSYVPRSITMGTRIPYSAPEFTLRLIAPIPASICKNERWDYLCDEPKKLAISQSFGGQIFFNIGTRSTLKPLWPTMSEIEYHLVLDRDITFFVSLLSPDRLVVHLNYYADGSSDDLPVGVIFERIKD